MNLILITAPTAEPVSVDQVRAQGRISVTEEDDLIDGYIKSAVQRLERIECWIQLITATRELRLDNFPDGDEVIDIPVPPLIAVSSIKYIDTDGDEQTLATSVYTVNIKSSDELDLGEVYLAYNQTWPSTRGMRDAVKIQYTCGYGDEGADVPASLRNWIMMAAVTMYENRELIAIEPGLSMVLSIGTNDGLLDAYRVKSHAR